MKDPVTQQRFSWLTEQVDPNKPWGLGCFVCMAANKSTKMGRCKFGTRLGGLTLYNLQRHGNNLAESQAHRVQRSWDHEEAVNAWLSQRSSECDRTSRSSDESHRSDKGGQSSGGISHGHVLYALTVVKTAGAASTFPVWLNTARLVGAECGPGFGSRQVCGQMIHVLGRRVHFETSLLLRESSVIGLAQDARDSEVVLRGKGVLWKLPSYFTRSGSMLPEGTHGGSLLSAIFCVAHTLPSVDAH